MADRPLRPPPRWLSRRTEHGALARLPVGPEELADPELGEVLVELLTCPVCGYTGSRGQDRRE